jgi:hypothetical protein
MPIESDERWDELQDLILQAVGHSERQNTDPDDAARTAVGDITTRDYASLVRDLVDRRLLRARMVEIAEEAAPIDARVEGLTPSGRERVRSAPARRSVFLDGAEKEQIEAFVTIVLRAVDAGTIPLSKEDGADLLAQLETLTAQARSPRPRRSIMGGVLKVVATIGANVAADIISSGATNLIHLLGV